MVDPGEGKYKMSLCREVRKHSKNDEGLQKEATWESGTTWALQRGMRVANYFLSILRVYMRESIMRVFKSVE